MSGRDERAERDELPAWPSMIPEGTPMSEVADLAALARELLPTLAALPISAPSVAERAYKIAEEWDRERRRRMRAAVPRKSADGQS